MIYFAQAIDGGPIKIGHSGNLDVRLRQLEIHYDRPLVLLASVEGGRDEERQIHRRFSHLRIGRTEQFRPGPELMEFIGQPPLAAVEGAAELAPRRGLIVIQATKRYRRFLNDVADKLRTTQSGALDRIFADWCEKNGFGKPPPRV